MDGRLIGGRYRLLETHAVGGMASIWRAVDESTGEQVAVKRLHPHLVADQDARERFLREAAAMSTVRHPNVVGVHEAVGDEEPALVLEFVPGSSLADLQASGQRFSEVDATSIAADIADGLSAAHARGIIHRDVKPANVLVGDDGRARLTDFGIALSLDDEDALTAADGVVGTLRYLAPERIAGEPADPSTDVWGVGTILYELVAGAPAFPSSTLAERIETASNPVDRPASVSDRAWKIIRRCLDPDPSARYGDAADLAAELRRLPGVPPPLASTTDPGADTEVIRVIPVPAADGVDAPPGGAVLDEARHAWSRVRDRLTERSTSRPEPRVAGGLVAAAVVLLLAVAFIGGRDAGAPANALQSPHPSTATALPAVQAPTLTPTPTAEPSAKADQKGDGKGNGKGKGKGKGGG